MWGGHGADGWMDGAERRPEKLLRTRAEERGDAADVLLYI